MAHVFFPADDTGPRAPVWMTMREWYVCEEDGPPLGPVSADQLARGIVAGKVPRDAFVACAGDEAWQDILDVPEVIAALKSL